MVRRLFVILGVCGLVFGVGGCGASPNEYERLQKRKLEELEKETPAFFVSADEIGKGYKLKSDLPMGFEAVNCTEQMVPDVFVPTGHPSFATYVDGSGQRTVTVSAAIPDGWEYFGDFPGALSRDFDDRCRQRWEGEDGSTDWMVWESARIEGLGHGAFGFKTTQWRGYGRSVAYPPSQRELDTNEALVYMSSMRAYGRVGDYLVSVHINGRVLPPSAEDDLKRLWDMQVDKVLKLT